MNPYLALRAALMGAAVGALVVILFVMLTGCLGTNEVGVDQGTVINADQKEGALGSSCDLTIRMEDGSAKTLTAGKCIAVNTRVCVSKSVTPAIIEGCSWT
jgi:hypothetical protein